MTTDGITPPKPVRVAVVQAEPAWLDLQGSVKKVKDLIISAAQNDARLVAFPECFVPGYPAWIWSRIMDPALSIKYIKNSLRVNSREMEEIKATAAEHGISVVLGYSENDGDSLYMAQSIIDASGKMLMHRRKIKPTHMERTIFGDGSGNSLNNVVDVPDVGRVGALNCWEHIQPLLKYHTYHQREQIHVSAWPPLAPHKPDTSWGMSLEGCAAQSQIYALEGGTFVLHSTSVITDVGIKEMATEAGMIFEKAGGGCSAVYGPDGRRLTEALEPTEEGLVYASLDFDNLLFARALVDCCGHYSRPDMLWLGVDDRQKMHRKTDGDVAEGVIG